MYLLYLVLRLLISSRLFTAACASAQISFFILTGGEIQWMAAGRVLGGRGGMGLLLSGLPPTALTSALLFTASWIISPRFYDTIDHVMDLVFASFRHLCTRKKAPSHSEDRAPLISMEEERSRSPSPVDHDRANEKPRTSAKQPPSPRTAIVACFGTITVLVVVTVLQMVRPKSPPYAHMSGTIPITLIEAAWLQPINSEFCLPHPVEDRGFPFGPFGEYFNITPSTNWIAQSSLCSRENEPGPPAWLEAPGGPHGRHRRPHHRRPPPPPPGHHPHGPHRPGERPPRPPYNENSDNPSPALLDRMHDSGPAVEFVHGRTGGYVPLCDPLKVSNLEAGVAQTLAEGIQTKKPRIRNVLLLTLESTRKDVFPFKKDSHAYQTILSSYSGLNATVELDEKLAHLTDTAAFLTGESTGFNSHVHGAEKPWKSAFKYGMGGVNVHGAITQAAYTLKSLVSSHCGVEPLPVDFTEETNGRIYQACIPQILDTFSEALKDGSAKGNEKTPGNGEKEDYLSQEWTSAFIQAVTDQFDNQDLLNEQIGFKTTISDTNIADEGSKHYPPKQPRVNYFGYPESETMDYLRDAFVEGRQQGKRVFVSHLTSSTHHPFKTPEDWTGRTTYMEQQAWRSQAPFDEYLNTIKYQDEWISDIFSMLHDIGALEETLIIMTGDHGMAFKSVDQCQSAVNNGHISNFAIPLLFIHPDLPRLQLNASTTQLSIIPTILDLLLQTDALPAPAAAHAADLLPRYQGTSLIRDPTFSVPRSDGSPQEAFFHPFHFSAINPGGSLLAISDAQTSFRLILPLCSAIPFRFTDIAVDPTESDPAIAWTMDELVAIVRVKFGGRSTEWVRLAEELGRWWFWNQRGKWGYWGVARSTGRGGAERAGIGQIKHKHWWETK